MEHAVRGNRPAGGAWKYITAAGLLLPLLLQNAYHIRPKRDGAVGILCFQRSLPHLAVDASNLAANSERLVAENNIFACLRSWRLYCILLIRLAIERLA